MILLKVSGRLPDLEVYGERVALVEWVEILAKCIGHLRDSLSNVIACFNGNGNNLKLVFSSSVTVKMKYHTLGVLK